MKINTYAVNCNDAWLNTEGDDISGSYVKYKDHQAVVAELEAKCAALAAENVGLNDKMDKLATWPGIEFYSSAWEFNNGDGNAALEFMCDVQTPATDAFLAEVRAQGVEMVIAYHRERADALHHVDRNNAIRHSMAALDASDVAAQLRQDANTENHSMLSIEDCQAFVQAFTKGAAS